MEIQDIETTEHTVRTARHTTHYLAAGPEHGPLIIFVHGWPELAISWRHQLPVMAALGFRAVAPDMRGYGRSSVPQRQSDYALDNIVADMLELLASLGRESAVWVGHDWGSPVVWSLASHHPDRCLGVASLCVPYRTLELGLDACLELLDRNTYPEAEFPAGQWDYQLFYQAQFDAARAEMEANPYNTARMLFRKGDPTGVKQPAFTATIRRNGGWFGPTAEAPDMPRDSDVVSEADLCAYAAALKRNGFYGANAYYMNHQANAAYGESVCNHGFLDMPVLFLGARHDYVCETVESTLALPMRQHCRRLSEVLIDSGHWMAQERPGEVNAALTRWLATALSEHWPAPGGTGSP